MRRSGKPVRRSSRRDIGDAKMCVCKNCGNRFTDAYCNRCGQYYDTKRLTPRELWDNIAFSIVNFDKGVPYTLIQLFSRPGKMIRDYISGHRVGYSHPVALLLLLCTIYGIIVGVTASVVPASDPGEVSVDVAQKLVGDNGMLKALGYLLNKLFGSQLFLAVLPVPLYAWTAKRLFRKYGSRQYNYAEMIFMGLYMAAQRMCVSIVIKPFIMIFPQAGVLEVIQAAAYLMLTAWTFRQIFTVRWRSALWRSVWMYVFSLGLGILAVIVLIAIIILLCVLFAVDLGML